MIGVKLSDAKKLFFNPKAVTDPAERMMLKGLSKFGAFTMRGAQKSIKFSPDVSEPGQPPNAHAGFMRVKISKKGKQSQKKVSKFASTIFFFVERNPKNVVVGPILLDGGDPEAPSLLEYGGQGTIEKKRKFGVERIAATYRERPTMRPAMARETTNPKLRFLFEGKLGSS